MIIKFYLARNNSDFVCSNLKFTMCYNALTPEKNPQFSDKCLIQHFKHLYQCRAKFEGK